MKASRGDTSGQKIRKSSWKKKRQADTLTQHITTPVARLYLVDLRATIGLQPDKFLDTRSALIFSHTCVENVELQQGGRFFFPATRLNAIRTLVGVLKFSHVKTWSE